MSVFPDVGSGSGVGVGTSVSGAYGSSSSGEQALNPTATKAANKKIQVLFHNAYNLIK